MVSGCGLMVVPPPQWYNTVGSTMSGLCLLSGVMATLVSSKV